MSNHRPPQRSSRLLRENRAGPAVQPAANAGSQGLLLWGPSEHTFPASWDHCWVGGRVHRTAVLMDKAGSHCYIRVQTSEVVPHSHTPRGPSDSEWPEVTHSASSPQTPGSTQHQGEGWRGLGSG